MIFSSHSLWNWSLPLHFSTKSFFLQILFIWYQLLIFFIYLQFHSYVWPWVNTICIKWKFLVSEIQVPKCTSFHKTWPYSHLAKTCKTIWSNEPNILLQLQVLSPMKYWWRNKTGQCNWISLRNHKTLDSIAKLIYSQPASTPSTIESVAVEEATHF